MRHEDHEAHEGTQTTEYWSGGVLECWALLRRSNTAFLPSLTYLRRFAGPTLTTKTRRTRSSDRFSKQFSSSWLRSLRVLRGATLSLVAFPAALWLAGCMVGPDYKRPTTEIPGQFRAVMTPDAAASIADLKWFEVFKDERLQDLIRTALARTTTFEMRSLESMRRALILGSRRRISIQTSASGVDLLVLSFRGREHSASPTGTADETLEQFSSVYSPMRSTSGAGCAGQPSRLRHNCWPATGIAKP